MKKILKEIIKGAKIMTRKYDIHTTDFKKIFTSNLKGEITNKQAAELLNITTHQWDYLKSKAKGKPTTNAEKREARRKGEIKEYKEKERDYIFIDKSEKVSAIQLCIKRRKVESCEHCLWYTKKCPLLLNK